MFGHDMILPIKHRVDWELIRQQKKTQINRDNTRENKNRVDYDYKVVDDVMLAKQTAYNSGTPYTSQFLITLCWTNDTVSLHIGAT